MKTAIAEPDAAVATPTSQEVADAFGRAFEATCDVLAMLDTYVVCPSPGSLEHVAFETLIERVVPPGENFAEQLRRYLCLLPGTTEPRHWGAVPRADFGGDIPF